MTAALTAVAPRTTTTGRAPRRGPSRELLVPAALVVGAGGLRLWGLDVPDRLYFDEKYYAVDAGDYLDRGVEDGRPVHPPLGKWLIAAGMHVLGERPVGWRIASAVSGTVTVLVTYLLGRRLTGSVTLAGLAGLLVAVDGLLLTSSRIAMLDAFLGLFAALAVWLVLLDARARARAPGGLRASVVGSRWRWAAGVVLGLALATKWSGLNAVGVCGLLVLGVEATLHASSLRQRVGRVVAAGAGALVALVVVPLALHVVSYAGWFANYEQSYAGAKACADASPCDHGPVQRLGTLWDFQRELVRYHADLEATHPYRSSPAGWPVLARPVLQYREGCGPAGSDAGCVGDTDQRATIRGIGNPALWWSALLVYPVLAWRAVRRRHAPSAVVLVALLGFWLPWFAAGKPGYLFYAVPAVPFVALALAVAAAGSRRRRAATAALAAVAVVAVGLLVFFYPVLTGAPLDDAELRARLWLPSWS